MCNRGRNLLLFPNVFLMDQSSTQIRVLRPLSPSRTEVVVYCIAPVGESRAALAPMLAMLNDLASAGWPRPGHLVHGVREVEELFARASLDAWSAAGAHLGTTYVVEQAGIGWSGPVGRVSDVLDPKLFETEGTDVYLCGPPAMVAMAEKVLATLGVPDPRAFTEAFNPA